MSIDFSDSSRSELRWYDGLEEAPRLGERFLIRGPVGGLEAVLASPEQRQEDSPIAVICHPHPLYGGSMTNKVVHIVANTFGELGLPTLRFNFRGVGHSQGRFDQGRGEVQDLVAVCQWFRRRYPKSPLWLAGFSFGAFVAFQAHHRVDAERLLLIAPPVTKYDFNARTQIRIPWMVIQGGQDEVIAPEKVSAWVRRQDAASVSYEWLDDADHFFHGRLNHIREAIKQHWSR
jgi:alpha/beta superfamily hydrolase